MSSVFSRAAFVAAALAAFSFTAEARAAGKARPSSSPAAIHDGKRVIEFQPLENVQIQMPDESQHDFGPDFQARLTTRLTEGGQVILVDPVAGAQSGAPSAFRLQAELPKYEWPSSVVPAGRLSVQVTALSFTTGAKGDRSFYGFNDRLPGRLKNEYPMSVLIDAPGWFDDTFLRKGKAPFDSQAGLDLGEGLSIDLLFAWLTLKYATYRSELGLHLEIVSPLTGDRISRDVHVTGHGYFYDLSGSYAEYSAEIGVARSDAMLQAFRKAIDGAVNAVEESVRRLPLAARLDHVVADSAAAGGAYYLLGTGVRAEVQPGVVYEVIGEPALKLRVVTSTDSGALAEIHSGDGESFKEGMLLRQAAGEAPAGPRGSGRFLASSARPEGRAGVARAQNVSALALESSAFAPEASSLSVALPAENLKAPALKKKPTIGRAQAFLRSLVETVFLAYRVWRYSMYDRAYQADADPTSLNSLESGSGARPERAGVSHWARQIGLQEAGEMDTAHVPVVAIIDTGVDYNHSVVHDSLWLNPEPIADARGQIDRYGWDFWSNDSRPADDGYHGTEMAGAVLAVAPRARIMALKAFNPVGLTSSNALLESFRYAVDHGADVILCGWATYRASQALEQGVAYARERGVIVVAAAGDSGDDLARVRYYPASLSVTHDNVVSVTAVDENDELLAIRKHSVNFGQDVMIAAPGKLSAPEPRNQWVKTASSGAAAALSAGALARLRATRNAPGDYAAQIAALIAGSESLSALQGRIHEGKRLHLRR